MSYETWEDHGYGIISSDIKTTPERLKNLVALAPKYKQQLKEFFNESGTKYDDFFENLDEWEDYDMFPSNGDVLAEYVSPVTVFLKNVILEKENIDLYICKDYDGNEFMMLLPWYPWSSYTDEEKSLTKLKLCKIINKYVEMVATNKEKIKPDYQTCKNGG